MEKKTEQYDVIIIGGGAAGLTAGIYSGRARLKTLLIEKSLVGGLATYTDEIENYPGFPDGITGTALMNLYQKQAKKFGVKFKLTDVKSVDLEGEIKVVETFRIRYEAKVVIIASGGKPRLTQAKGEELFLYDKGISFCATCDAAANTDKTVMVIGSGDAAIEEGMFLTKFAKKVIVSVMHDKGIMDCNEVAKTQALANEKMEFIWNTSVDRFEGEEHLKTVVLKDVKTGGEIPIDVDSCFLFIGYVPNTEIFKGKVELTPHGYVVVNEKMETNISGVFGAGDVCDKFLKQVATAVGDGAIAGYAAEKYLAESEVFEHQILSSEKPVVVYLYNASDRPSCELLTELETFEAKNKEKCTVVKIDTYKSDGLAKRLNVPEIPSIVIVEDKKVKKVITQDINLSEIEKLF